MAVNYFVTGVWKNSESEITHVFLHKNTYEASKSTNTFNPGVKTSEAEVIRLINAGNLVMTLRWNYTNASWAIGARIEVVTRGTTHYLRSHKDSQVYDNLDNMINMDGFI